MRRITCPHCGRQVPLRCYYKAKSFCDRCAWNLDRAEAQIPEIRKSVAIVFLASAIPAGLFAMVFALSDKVTRAVYTLPAAGALLAVAPWWTYYSTRKAITAAKSTASPSLARPPEPDSLLRMLQSMPRPRPVRLRFRGRLSLGVVALMIILVALALGLRLLHRLEDLPPGVFPMLFLLLLISVIFAIPALSARRDAPLLRDGELAFGKVTAQQFVRERRTGGSRIHYEFSSATGQIVRDSCNDPTRALFEDMLIPVFYEAADPAKHITPLTTYLQVSSNPF